jgi:hypothetical protein
MALQVRRAHSETHRAKVSGKMDESYNLPTIYEGSRLCHKCGDLMDPVTVAFTGALGVCPECRNIMHKKRLKEAMSKGR